METLCEIMGFTTDPAKQYARACKDHHKSWSLLLVFHIAALREMVLPYIRDCLHTGEDAGAKGFLQFCDGFYQVENMPTFRYLFDMVTTLSQGIINFRVATRRNNSELLKSAKDMTSAIFHGRTHPKYQAIELFDMLQDRMMPAEVRNLNDQYASITTSGTLSTGEDFDYVLEEKNRQLKSWIPKGVPTDEIWQIVCRNNQYLEKVKQTSLALFGINLETGNGRPIDIQAAVESYQCVLRKKEYIYKLGDHTSISGVALDEGLVNFLAESRKRRNLKLQADILGKDVEEASLIMKHPIPITPMERGKAESIEQMTIPNIQKKIKELLEQIPDEMQYDYHQNIFTSEVVGKKKDRHVLFLRELRDALSQQGHSDIPTHHQ